MKKRLLFYLLFLFPAFALQANNLTHPDENHIPTATVEATNCEAPPPGWLVVTEATPSSISLMWENGQINTLFRVRGYNVTGGYALPTYYTYLNAITYDSLEAGNYYRFDVSATYCPEAPVFERIIEISKWTPRIIVEDIVEVQEPCTPDQEEPTGNGVVLQFCVPFGAAEPYEDAFNCRLKYNTNQNYWFDFAILYDGQDVRLGETTSNPNFQFLGSQNTVKTCYVSENGLSVKIFSVSNPVSTGTEEASINIKFFGTFHKFEHCHSCDGERSSGSNPSRPPSEKTTMSPDNAVLTQVSPNPFSESTTFRYALSEPGPVEISLYDAMGRLVKVVEKTTQQTAGEHSATVDGADLPEGVYFLHAITGQNRQVFSLVKQE